MESKLSVGAIKSYSIEFADRICDQFFHSKLKITGKEILTVSPEKQVNLFVLKNLFRIWEQENEKLKSPYFNYDAEEVKSALDNFLNLLSQNISISRVDFEPLLVQSVYDALLLLLSPYDYYRMELSSNKVIKASDLKKFVRYITINKHLINDLILKFQNRDISELDTKSVLSLFDQVCEQSTASPDDIDEHFKLLGQIKPVKADDFYSSEQSIPQTPRTERRMEQETNENKRILAETFVMNSPTINEKFGSETNASLAEKLQKTKIQSIKSSLPINQKFIYINNLFKGSIQDFAEAADKIDECTDLTSVKHLINDTFIPKYQWNTNDEVYKEFVEIVERRFL